ncbi:MAG: Ger(x)C family spore germination protein [Clostridia bacterium]|nr:Ger(x)C family spore germination protein [Clostridia bacterium]
MQKLNKLIFLFILIFFLLILTGCQQASQNIEDFYFVVAVGIDKGESSLLNLTIQIATSNNSGDSSDSAQSSTSVIYSAECNSINSGISVFNNYLSKKLNFSHCSAIIFSEDIAKSGIRKYIECFENNPEIRPTSKVIISNTQAKETLECISNTNESFSANLYEFIINSSEYTGYSINPSIFDMFYNLTSKTKDIVATYANVSDDNLQNAGIAIFDDDKFITSLPVLDSICYSIITNQLNSCLISIENPIDGGTIDISVKRNKNTKINTKLINNYPYINLDCSLEYTVQNSEYNVNTESVEKLKILENAINSYLEQIILNFLYEISHEYNIDICDFQNDLSSNYLTYDDFEKVHWNEIYKDSYFNVNVEGIIYDGGLFAKE